MRVCVHDCPMHVCAVLCEKREPNLEEAMSGYCTTALEDCLVLCFLPSHTSHLLLALSCYSSCHLPCPFSTLSVLHDLPASTAPLDSCCFSSVFPHQSSRALPHYLGLRTFPTCIVSASTHGFQRAGPFCLHLSLPAVSLLFSLLAEQRPTFLPTADSAA